MPPRTLPCAGSCTVAALSVHLAAALHNLLKEYYKHQASKEYQIEIQKQKHREQHRKKLRAKALAARREFKHAQRLRKEVEEYPWLHALNKQQESLLYRLDKGILYEKMIAANQAYGHGVGAQGSDYLSIEEIMVIESTCGHKRARSST